MSTTRNALLLQVPICSAEGAKASRHESYFVPRRSQTAASDTCFLDKRKLARRVRCRRTVVDKSSDGSREKPMPISTIHVQYRDGSPARQSKIVLGFVGGMTKPAFTDSYGDAVIEHASSGAATVYVSGRAYHSFHAPGRTGVTIH
jgi:hypothetical protein